jgi:imidazolonepropionase-like amidohydrolase
VISRRILLGALLTLALAPPLAQAGTTPQLGLRETPPAAIAFVHGKIVVGPDQVLEDATLVVRQGRVEKVGTGIAPPPDALVHDLRGRWVFPGFIDPYTDYGLSKAAAPYAERQRGGRRGSQDEPSRRGARATNDAFHAQERWADHFEPDLEAAEAFWKRGTTAVQAARLDGILRGRGYVALLGRGPARESLLDPEALHFASFDKGSSPQSYPTSLMGSIALVRQAFLDARWYDAVWQAHRKSPAGAPPEVDLTLAALAANRDPIVFEADDDPSLLRAGHLARELGLSFYLVGSGFEHGQVAAVAELGAPLLLPMSLPRAPDVSTLDAQQDVALADLRHWDLAPSNAAWLAERGVRFAFTAFRLGAREDGLANVRRMVRRGLPRATALAALTTVPAELLGLQDQIGRLAPGLRADFVVADADLLTQDEAQVVSVWVGAEAVHEAERLDQIDFRGRYALTGLATPGYELTLEREEGEYSGTLRLESKEADAREVQLEPTRLRFQADLSDLGSPETARFEIRHSASALTGRLAHGDGRIETFSLERLPDLPRTEGTGRSDGKRRGKHSWKRDKKQPETPPIARRTFPLTAHGRTEPPRAENVLIQNATVWTAEAAGVLEGADILVAQGKIAAVGKSLKAPAGTRVLDATGLHVTPGLIDEHSHLAISGGVNEGSHAVTAEVRIGDVLDPEDVGLYRAIAGGTTTGQLLHGSANPIGGQAQIIKHRWGRSAEELRFAGAPPSIKLALGENVKQSNWGDEARTRYPQTRMGVETLIKDAFLAARRYADEHQRYAALPAAAKAKAVPPRRDLQLEALAEILAKQRFMHVHSYVQSEMLMLIRLAERLGVTIQTFTHVLEGYKVAPEMARHGAGASSFSDWWAFKFEVYDAIPYNPCLLTEAGVVTSVNSDSPDLIRRLNTEAAKSVLYCGMAPAQALQLVTLNPAKQLKIDDRVGSLVAGKDADLVLWNGPPLSSFSRVEETWIDGARYFSRSEDERIRREDAAERQALIAKVLREGETDRGNRGYANKRDERIWDCEDVEDVWHAKHDHTAE